MFFASTKITSALSLSAALCTLAMPQMSFAQIQSVELEPSSQWTFAARSDTCRISRSFGEAETQTVLTIDQAGIAERYNITLAGKYVSKPFGPLLKLRFGDQNTNSNTHHKTVLSNGATSLKVYGLVIAPKSETYDSDIKAPALSSTDLAKIETLHITRARPRPFSLAIGPISEQLAALRLCARDLSTALDAAWNAQESGANRPNPIEPEKWFVWRDYPRHFAINNKESAIHIRLTVNASGATTDCVLLDADLDEMYSNRMCTKLIQRALFEPAKNAQGEAIASYFYSQYSFRFKK